jgi:hypothetical protein
MADYTLTRFLSVNTAVSTASSIAERHQVAADGTPGFREIGTGSIGTVFEHLGTIWAHKLPLTDDTAKLWNNHKMHRLVADSFEGLSPDVAIEIPKLPWFAKDESKFWAENVDRFPWTDRYPRRPRHIMCMERIFPVPKATRKLLIDRYCPEERRDYAKVVAANKHCLIRPLMGRKRQNVTDRRLRIFSLRNFKLHLDLMQDLDLNPLEMMTTMASPLAILHYHPRIDGIDAQFVLGSTPTDNQSHQRTVPLASLGGTPTST